MSCTWLDGWHCTTVTGPRLTFASVQSYRFDTYCKRIFEDCRPTFENKKVRHKAPTVPLLVRKLNAFPTSAITRCRRCLGEDSLPALRHPLSLGTFSTSLPRLVETGKGAVSGSAVHRRQVNAWNKMAPMSGIQMLWVIKYDVSGGMVSSAIQSVQNR